MSTSFATRTATVVPAVNLLPPEFAEREQLRKLQAIMAAACVAAVLLVGALWLYEQSATASAQEELDSSRNVASELMQAKDKYREVPRELAALKAAESSLTQAMGDEVRWSVYLAELSRSVPKNVWLSEMTATTDTGEGLPGPTGEAAPTSGRIGQVSFKGYARSYSAVAQWLEALQKQKGYSDAWSRDMRNGSLSLKEKLVEFESSVSLTPEARSGRYTNKGAEE